MNTLLAFVTRLFLSPRQRTGYVRKYSNRPLRGL